MASEKKNGRSAVGRNIMQLIVFVSATITIISFSYLNLYDLPLGSSDVSSIINDSESLYGMTVSAHGIIDTTMPSEFSVIDVTTSDSLDAIWIGDGYLPIDGTEIIATGQLVATPHGPTLLADDASPMNENVLLFDSAWELPTFRLLCVIILWFIMLTFFTALFAIAYLMRHNVLVGNWMRALSELTIISGLIVALIMLLFIESERFTFGIPTIVLIGIIPVMILSLLIRKVRNTEVAELADAIPPISGLLGVLTLLLIFIQQQLGMEDLLATALIKIFPESVLPISIGVAGMILIGTYITARRQESTDIADVFALVKIGVK